MANRLAAESSPYLLLHAENPVDWYPWGEEAFEASRADDRPIFLSVGYSTCYWCHVMERESFTDPEVARAMNEGFVNVKVDREERPDVDEIYMAATQLLTRSGGWPNSVFLTPDLKPFFAGTYFPPHDGMGRPSFSQVLQALRQAWLMQRPELLQRADAVAEAMELNLAGAAEPSESVPDPVVAETLQNDLAGRFDRQLGGFGQAPKFPSPSNLDFLLDRAEDSRAREMLLVTLDHMARGGLMDQLAGGFHRYSTDAHWLVPHFEKMLYDNAALARLYAEAAVLAPEAGFERVARFTLDFVLREMTSDDGGFLSAIDAETDGHEGAYYTWTEPELDEVLASPDGELFRTVYGLKGAPTFETDRYVVYLPEPIAMSARTADVSQAALRERLEAPRKALLAARDARERPLTDDKILTDWNGLMIGAMARVGELLDERSYIQAASQAAEFVLGTLRDEDGTLLHTFRDGRAHVPAFLDDYAFLVEGLLRLRSATGDERWLDEAVRLMGQQEERLGEPEAGGYFAAAADPRLLFRARPAFDGAVSSGNGMSVLNLVELADLTKEVRFRERAEAALRAFGDGITRAPIAHVTLIRGLTRLGSDSAFSEAPTPPPPRPQDEAPTPSALDALEEEAREVVEVEGSLGRADDETWKPFTLDLEIRPGFHVNGNTTEDPSLVATTVKAILGDVRKLKFPAVERGQDGASGYRGRVRIEGEIERRGGGASSVELAYQACDDSRCLPPVTRIVRLR